MNTSLSRVAASNLLPLNHFLRTWSQIIIVDDASTDKTTEVASKFSAKHENLIRILRLGENHGKGGAVKLGIQRARGRLILMVHTLFLGINERVFCAVNLLS